MDQILSEVQKRPYSLQPLSAETLKAVWEALCTLIYRTLTNGKGFGMSNFGIWTFRADCQDLGNTKKTLKTPVFILSEKFARTYSLSYKKQLATGGIPVTNLNTLAIANLAGRSRDEANAALKDIFLYVGDIARSGRTLRLEFTNVGQFVCSNCSGSFTFYPPFSETYEVAGFSTRAPLRPSTAPSVGRRTNGYVLDWETPAMRPTSSQVSSRAASRPSTAKSVADDLLQSVRDSSRQIQQQQQQQQPKQYGSRPSTANSYKNDNNQYNNTNSKALTTMTVGRTDFLNNNYNNNDNNANNAVNYFANPSAAAEHSDLCRCKHCIVRQNYNRQIEEKYAKQGVEERMDKELIKMSLTRNERLLTREKREEETRRNTRKEIEHYNAEAVNQCLHTKKQFGPLPYDDMFQHKINETRATLTKNEFRESLMQQLAVKHEEQEQVKRMENAHSMISGDMLRKRLEEEQMREREQKLQTYAQRRSELESQMKEKRSVLTEAVVPATWEAIPKAKPLDLLEKREIQRKMQSETLAEIKERELQREREKQEEARRVQEELQKLQQAIEKTEMLNWTEAAAKKKQARDIWTSQMDQRKRLTQTGRRPLSGSTGFTVGGLEPNRHVQHSGPPVPLSEVLMAQSLPFR